MAYSKDELQAELIRREAQKRGLVNTDPQAVPDDQAISPDQFQTADQMQQQKALETQQILGDPKDPNFDTSGLQEWEYKGGLVTGAKRQPGFLKTLDMINTGVDRGVKHFTLGLMSMLPLGTKYQNAIKKVDADVEAEQQKNIKTYDSIAPQLGEVGGELLATAPAGGLLGKVFSKSLGLTKGAGVFAEGTLPSKILSSVGGSSLIDKGLPQGLKLLGGYGNAAVAGAGVLSGTEALKYQGDQFDFGKAGDKFVEGMQQPSNYILPAAGTAIGRYLDKTRDLQKVLDEGIDVLPRDLKEKGLSRTISQLAADSFSTLTPLGRRAEQLQNIGGSIGNVIKKIARTPEALSTDDYIQYASKNLQMGLQKLNAKETILWENGGFKNAQINNLEELLPDINQAKEIISRVKLPTYGQTKALIDESLSNLEKGKITFEDIKNVGSILGDAAQDAYNLGQGTGTNIGNKLSEIRRNLLENAAGNLSDDQLKAYNAAKAFTKNLYELEDAIPLVKDAITDQMKANQVVKGILKDSLSFDTNKAMGLMSDKGQAAVKAAKIAEALSKARSPGNGVNLNTFLKEVAPADNAVETSQAASYTKKLLGDEYKHIEGLAKHLEAINEAKKIGSAGKFMLPMVGAGAAAGLGATGNLNMDTVKAVAPYAAMLFAANHPILKKLLGASTKKLSDSTYKHLTNKIQTLFTRAGFIYNDDGSMSKEGED